MILNDILDSISDKLKKNDNKGSSVFIDPSTGKAVIREESENETIDNAEEKISIFGNIKELPFYDFALDHKKQLFIGIIAIILIGFFAINIPTIKSATDDIQTEIEQQKEEEENRIDYTESITSQGENQEVITLDNIGE